MKARSIIVRALRLAWRILRVLFVIAAAVGAGWATWSIHHAGHPWPASVLAVVAALGAAKLIHDLTHRRGGTS